MQNLQKSFSYPWGKKNKSPLIDLTFFSPKKNNPKTGSRNSDTTTPKGILVIWLLKAARTSVWTNWLKLSTLPNHLVGCWTNPFEKYQSNWMISPGRGEKIKYLKPPPSHCWMHLDNASLSHGIMLPCSSTWFREQQAHVVSLQWKSLSCSSPCQIPRQ